MTFAWWHVPVAFIPMIPNFWSIWDIWTHAFPTPERRIYWLMFVIFVPVLGGLIYIFIGRKHALPRR